MDINQKLTEELGVKKWQVEAAVKLIDEGNTIPFISRYRKEVTGSLNDEQLRQLFERLTYLRNLEEKKEQVLSSIEEQEKLTEELRRQIMMAETLVVVDDLYRPYRPKRRTRATIAKEKGLESLAALITMQKTNVPVEESAKAYLSEEKGVQTVEEALAGAKDIIAEYISDEADYRIYLRNFTAKQGKLISTAKDDTVESVYEMYYDFEEPVNKLAGHRVLALNRGEKEKILQLKIEVPEEKVIQYLEKKVIHSDNAYTTPILKEAIEDSYKRLIAPAIEREIRNELTEKAEDGAISVFGKNLEQLLMQPPIANKVVLGWDPAFRTGCKLAVVDETGKVLDTTVIYPTAPTTPQKIAQAKETLKKLIRKYGITLISLGNGTASRESEMIIVELLKEIPENVQYMITNEAGASVYSASKLATEEFPQFDVGQRSAASIARRVQDPLAELVKIEPKSIGVGQYQHDLNQKKLSETLSGVVEDCVNKVGVDLNTASAPLLSYISGISSAVAKNIVAYREENGRFKSRKELLKVAKLGPKAFEQCAGFMRIQGGKNPLDSTSVHPESYEVAEKLLEKQGFSLQDIAEGKLSSLSKTIKDEKKLANELEVGEITLKDIIKELEKPGRDPRDEMPKPILRTDVLEMKDLTEGMVLKGTVRNVIDFGVFVDIGVHQDGLVHISQITDKKFIKHPLEVVSVGDIVDVKVMSVDVKKKRIQLTMKGIS
ncbi:competence protein ComEA helix-hairpin-helix repeat region [Lachnospiraceae bacterium 2_1_46FAA]|nr:competence protein ComEA helix-hairpin-helix repeat region [Lachnospiraceae bacterium 2_1_46FAA]